MTSRPVLDPDLATSGYLCWAWPAQDFEVQNQKKFFKILSMHFRDTKYEICNHCHK